FPPDRVSPTSFVGSLFKLQPGTPYDVRVTLRDPDGAPLDGLTLTGTQSTRPEVVVPPPLRTRVASPMGVGTACDRTQPCSLPQAVVAAIAGDEVVLLPGKYHISRISPIFSGAPGAPIVIRPDVPGTAVIDGAHDAPLAWTAVGGGV